MARDRLLPLSIFTLAAAVALHAMSPARAQDAAPVAPPPAPAAAAPIAPIAPVAPPAPPECRNLRVGTAKELSTLMGELQAKGHGQFLVVGSSLLCGWR